MTLHRLLCTYRLYAGVTISEMAKALSVKPSKISAVEHGVEQCSTRLENKIDAYFKGFGMDTGELKESIERARKKYEEIK